MIKEEFKTLPPQKFMRAKQLAEHLKISAKKISERVTVFEVAEVEKALLGGAV